MDTRGFPLEIKSIAETGEIVGLAAAFGNIDHGGDRILPGAFAKSLAHHRAIGSMPAMLLHHDLNRPVGRWDELTETNDGLLAKGRFTLASRDGAEAYALTRDGALKGLSIGYAPEVKADRRDARDLLEVKLFEVSLVSVPMNERARIQTVKSIAGARDIEGLLRDAGLSNRQAKAAAGAAWRAINQTDDDEAALAAILTAATARLYSN